MQKIKNTRSSFEFFLLQKITKKTMGISDESNRIFSSTYNFNVLKYRDLDADIQVVVYYKEKLIFKPI